MTMPLISLGNMFVRPGADPVLFSFAGDHGRLIFTVGQPEFEINFRPITGFTFAGLESQSAHQGGLQAVLRYIHIETGLMLRVELQGYASHPVLRFRYQLSSDQPTQAQPYTLTKINGGDHLHYFTVRSRFDRPPSLTEIRLSHFDPLVHSYLPGLETYRPAQIYPGLALSGPIAILQDGEKALLVAYEHGADSPNSFVSIDVENAPGGPPISTRVPASATSREFQTSPPGLSLRAVKGNYANGHALTRPWQSIWFELLPTYGSLEDLLPQYRRFILDGLCPYPESRKPYLYYNTWNFQERQRYLKGRPYLESMNLEHILGEIKVAHQLGVDVYVLDAGWFDRTGDWTVNPARFPDGLQQVRKLLDEYSMKLGLWLNPTAAALTSRVFRAHPEWEMITNNRPTQRGPVWETEESASLCLVSDYADHFASTLARLYHDLGVRYFKWDGVAQTGCNSPLHDHGSRRNSPEERADCYAFEVGRRMIQIVEQAAATCPDLIVDLDITESSRFMGLGFLSAGKYFLVNNGPYFSDLDIPPTTKIDPDTINVFFHPGPARARACRSGARFDRILPAHLFLTHFLPDPPRLSQSNNLAALMLGGNGLWGDLLGLNEGERAVLAGVLMRYKRVASAAVRAYPVIRGFPGSSPEIYEKIDPVSGRGLVAFFTVAPGTFTYLTQPLQRLGKVQGADSWEVTPDNRLKLTVQLNRSDARVVFIS